MAIPVVADAANMGCYVSTGDNDWLWTSPPVNSQAGVEALLESLDKVFGVDRIYWRGTHAEWALDHMVARPESLQANQFWEWERHLVKEKGQTEWAIKAARKRGMEIWGMNPLFDHGAQARSDCAKIGTPSPVELKLRVEHPEYVPVDRYGIRRQAGPVEFAYPQVRKELIRQYVDLMTRRNYDGIMFYTYVEHCSLRFEDEYGFNQPIVDEFKRRYGQDIREEKFDKNAWYRLRGEYVTQFLRELSVALRKRGKKLGMAVDPQDSHLPAPWLCVRDVRPTGRIYMDWERWVSEGIVDEIMVYCNGSLEKALNAAVAVTKGTKCTVSTIHSAPWPAHHEHLGRADVRRVMCGSYDYIEWGYKEEQPASALGSDDFLKRLRVLRQATEKKTELPLPKIVSAVQDPNLFVRRQAIRTLVAFEDREAIPAIERALTDAEVSVRCTAAASLCKLHRPGTVAKVFEALRKSNSFQFDNAAVSCLANLPTERTAEILPGCKDHSVTVRRATAYALSRGVRRPESVPHLTAAMDDADAQVRHCAARALARFTYLREVGDCLLAHLDDPHPSVKCYIAIALRSAFQSKSRWINARQHKAVAALTKRFAQFTESYQGSDGDWAFRPIGNSLLATGPRGREALQRFMDQREDKQLADYAWRILHVPQTGWRYVTCTEQEAEKGYRLHPIVSGWKPVSPPTPPAEPERMPYLQQNFDSFDLYAKGKLGDYLHDGGQWRGLGDTFPQPAIQGKIRRGNTGHAVQVRRGPGGSSHGLQGLRADYRLTTEHAIVDLWLYRPSPQSSLAVTWQDSGSGHWYLGLYVAPGGKVSVVNKSRTWAKTEASMPHGTWQRVRFDIDGAKLKYTVSMASEQSSAAVGRPLQRATKRSAQESGSGEPIPPRRQNIQVVLADIPFPEGQQFNMLSLSPQGQEGNVTYLDDVVVTVPNPAR